MRASLSSWNARHVITYLSNKVGPVHLKTERDVLVCTRRTRNVTFQTRIKADVSLHGETYIAFTRS
jgi:hypothetical protein